MSPWISAARPKTLPLAISGILFGSAIAYLNGVFHWQVFVFGILTAALLQLLSNFANDYGDFIKGTDSAAGREDRALASGKISEGKMKMALFIVSGLVLISGFVLLQFSELKTPGLFYLFFLLGLAGIAAAIKYTVGKKAYGYSGWGDLFVLIFFGFVSVSGIFFLHTGKLILEVNIAAFSCGLLCTSVLNINNIRDLESDKKSEKKTLPVRLGFKRALIYQRLLVWLGVIGIILSFITHTVVQTGWPSTAEFGMVVLVFSPIFLIVSGHLSRMKMNIFPVPEDSPADTIENQRTEPRALFNKELKTISLTTFALSIIYWILVFLYI